MLGGLCTHRCTGCQRDAGAPVMVFGASSSCDLRPAARCWQPALLLADRLPRALLGVFSAPGAPHPCSSLCRWPQTRHRSWVVLGGLGASREPQLEHHRWWPDGSSTARVPVPPSGSSLAAVVRGNFRTGQNPSQIVSIAGAFCFGVGSRGCSSSASRRPKALPTSSSQRWGPAPVRISGVIPG